MSDPAGSARLPDQARLRVVELVAAHLGELDPAALPASLRPVARFTPAKRARVGAVPIAAALETDDGFRAVAAAAVQEALPELAAALAAGRVPPAAPPADVAALAYLLRPEGWQQAVADTAAELERVESAAAAAARQHAADRLRHELSETRAAAKAEADRLRGEVHDLRAESRRLRRELKEARDELRRAAQSRDEAEEQAKAAGRAAEAAMAEVRAELRRTRSQLAEVEAAVAAGRRSAREGRNADDMRLWLLLDTLNRAAAGLRSELALPPPSERPGDLVVPARDGEAYPGLPSRGLGLDDPAVLDQLLALPTAHLLVDGYNVTKTGYGSLTLEEQRTRLLGALGGLAGRGGLEVTVVFDGAERPGPVAPATPRGVRLLFSEPGQTADDLIRRLVGAEPPGRPLVVVSSDREVADSVRRQGAWAVPATALLRRLGRG